MRNRNPSSTPLRVPGGRCLPGLLALVLSVCLGWGRPVPAAEGAGDDDRIERQIRRLEERLRRPDLGAQDVILLQSLVTELRSLQQTKRIPTGESALMEELEQLLVARLGTERNRFAQEMLARWHLFRDQPEKAVAILRDLRVNPDVDITWSALMVYGYIRLGDYRRADHFFEHLGRLMKKRTALRLHPPVLADRVTAFRLYEPRSERILQPGEMLTLYIEMGGVHFARTGPDTYQCRLLFGIELRDRMQTPVYAEPEFGTYDPVYRGPIQDMHAVIYFRLPHNLQPGRYTLLVKATDLQGDGEQAQDEAAIELEIGGRERPVLPDASHRDPQRERDGRAPGGETAPPGTRQGEPFRQMTPEEAMDVGMQERLRRSQLQMEHVR